MEQKAMLAISDNPVLTEPVAQNDFVDEITAALRIGRPITTLRRWRQERKYLKFYRHGRAVRYKLSDISDFLERGAVEVTH